MWNPADTSKAETDRSKISCNHHRIFFSFFANIYYFPFRNGKSEENRTLYTESRLKTQGVQMTDDDLLYKFYSFYFFLGLGWG